MNRRVLRNQARTLQAAQEGDVTSRPSPQPDRQDPQTVLRERYSATVPVMHGRSRWTARKERGSAQRTHAALVVIEAGSGPLGAATGNPLPLVCLSCPFMRQLVDLLLHQGLDRQPRAGDPVVASGPAAAAACRPMRFGSPATRAAARCPADGATLAPALARGCRRPEDDLGDDHRGAIRPARSRKRTSSPIGPVASAFRSRVPWPRS